MDNYAITVRGAFKYYGGKVAALDGVTLKVEKGIIYALLGPSGCGKSTLMNAIIGLLDLDYGEIRTTEKNKQKIGYMPQINKWVTRGNMQANTKSQLEALTVKAKSEEAEGPGNSGSEVNLEDFGILSRLEIPKWSFVKVGGETPTAIEPKFPILPGQHKHSSFNEMLKEQYHVAHDFPSKWKILDYLSCKVDFCLLDTLLYSVMSTEELFQYFGKVYKMEKSAINERISELTTVLNFQHIKIPINCLSGGECRRASLAIAMINEPKICLLDEPTCGIDPVLRSTMWKYFKRICDRENRTIIITTHYIEEARQADKIALMRDGKILCEASPESIITETNSNTLEEAFLRLCSEKSIGVSDPVKTPPVMAFSMDQFRCDGNILLAELWKNAVILRKNALAFMLICIAPALTFVCFHFFMGLDPKGLPIGFVNEELPFGCNMKQHYKPTNSCFADYVSCELLHKMEEKTLKMEEYDTIENGISAVKHGLRAVTHIQYNFSKALFIRLEEFPLDLDDATIDNSEISSYMDRTDYVIDNFITKTFNEAYTEFIKDIYKNCGWNEKTVQPIMRIKKLNTGRDSSFQTFLVSPLVNMTMFLFPIYYILLVFQEDKDSGVVARSLSSGVTITEFLMGHFFFQLCIVLINVGVLVTTVFGILGHTFNNQLLSILLMFLLGFSGIEYAFMLALLLEMQAFVILTMALTLTTMFIGGVLWPLEGMHPFVRVISWAVPTTFTIDGLRSLTAAVDFSVKKVLLGFISCIVWIVAFALLNIFYISYKKSKIFLK